MRPMCTGGCALGVADSQPLQGLIVMFIRAAGAVENAHPKQEDTFVLGSQAQDERS